MKFKVCGMREPDNIKALSRLNPDYVGFIFYEPSPRNAFGMPREAVADVNGVAVFVNAPDSEIIDICDYYGFTTVQLHGDESPDFCRRLSERGLRIFKAFGLDSEPCWDEIASYEEAVDMFVFDTRTRRRGGSGQKFDWAVLTAYSLHTPYLLSGGIGPDDIIPVLPGMAGVDLNSRFEEKPGRKNIELIEKFLGNEQNRLTFCSQEP